MPATPNKALPGHGFHDVALRWFTWTEGAARYGDYPANLDKISAVDLEQAAIATDAELCTALGLDAAEFAGWPEAAQELAQDVVDRAVWEAARAGSIAALETADAIAQYDDRSRVTNPEEVTGAREEAAHVGFTAYGQARHLTYHGPRDHRSHDREASRA